jgi:hypothetical protein
MSEEDDIAKRYRKIASGACDPPVHFGTFRSEHHTQETEPLVHPPRVLTVEERLEELAHPLERLVLLMKKRKRLRS